MTYDLIFARISMELQWHSSTLYKAEKLNRRPLGETVPLGTKDSFKRYDEMCGTTNGAGITLGESACHYNVWWIHLRQRPYSEIQWAWTVSWRVETVGRYNDYAQMLKRKGFQMPHEDRLKTQNIWNA